MIDEPLSFLAEAFGQDAETAILPLPGGTSAGSADLDVVAAACVGPAEATARTLRGTGADQASCA